MNLIPRAVHPEPTPMLEMRSIYDLMLIFVAGILMAHGCAWLGGRIDATLGQGGDGPRPEPDSDPTKGRPDAGATGQGGPSVGSSETGDRFHPAGSAVLIRHGHFAGRRGRVVSRSRWFANEYFVHLDDRDGADGPTIAVYEGWIEAAEMAGQGGSVGGS